MATTSLVEVIQTYEIGPNRARLNANLELQKFDLDDVRRILDRMQPLPKTSGSNYPCGPVYNRHEGIPIWMRLTLWSVVSSGAAMLLPLQVGAALVLLFRRRFTAIWRELPVPTIELIDWGRDMMSFVKAPMGLVRRSVDRAAALCVNRRGAFSIRDADYTVMSHVWGETMGWQTPTAWGPVDLSLRKMGIARSHFLRFFDRCGAEWLWVDVVAMPEVLEDMSAAQKDEIEGLRVGVINNLHSIYTKADKVIVLDSLLLRLNTRSPVDVAVVLCLSFWMTRVWTYIEARLAKKVTLRTQDHDFDLDEVVQFLDRTVLNDEHRYFALLWRLLPLRDESQSRLPPRSLLESAFMGSENRYTDVPVDQARALFPLLGLKWEHGWTLQEGLSSIVENYPQDASWVQKWCNYRSIEFNVPNEIAQ